MNLEGAAARFAEIADRCEAGLAIDAVKAMVQVYVPVLKGVTPVRTGRLRDSEYPDFIAGNGVAAAASVAPHTEYAEFRNFGGTITAKNFPQLGNPDVGWFGKSVTQQGSHYMERGHDAAEGPCRAAAHAVADEYLTL